MHLRNILLIFLIILSNIQLTCAGDAIHLSPDGGHSNQKQINKALEKGNVYLEAGIYEVDDSISILPNRVLTGDSNAIIRVWSGSSQYFKGLKGVICYDGVAHDIEISNIQIDGNIKNLPKNYANSRSDTRHDCQKLIILHGYSNQFASNIKLHDLKLYNSFSDGIYLLYVRYAACYNNFISNCQHEGTYYSVVQESILHNNNIAGIVSDCARLDNCKNIKVYKNIFFSYAGDSYGAYKGGQSGLQIGDAGSSMGYNAKKTGFHTTNIEVTENTFAAPGVRGIWLDAAGLEPSTNVYIYNNKYVGVDGLETMGIPVGDISYENSPTVEMSENVFSSIFDILDVEFTDSGRTEQKAEDFNYTVVQTEKGKVAGGIKIIGFNNWIKIDNESYISNPEDAIIKTSIVKAPSLAAWSGEISKVDKEVNISLENGTATATLTAKVEWYNLKVNSKGEKAKGKLKTSEYKFTDTYYQAPKLFESPSNITGIVYQYPTYFTLYVPSKGLTSIEYKYGGNFSEHIFLVGEKNTTSEGVKFTEYSSLEHWEGRLQHQGKWISVNDEFDESKLNITANTPYEQINVKNFTVIQKEFPTKVMADWLAPFFWIMVILALGCWYMFKHIWY